MQTMRALALLAAVGIGVGNLPGQQTSNVAPQPASARHPAVEQAVAAFLTEHERLTGGGQPVEATTVQQLSQGAKVAAEAVPAESRPQAVIQMLLAAERFVSASERAVGDAVQQRLADVMLAHFHAEHRGDADAILSALSQFESMADEAGLSPGIGRTVRCNVLSRLWGLDAFPDEDRRAQLDQLGPLGGDGFVAPIFRHGYWNWKAQVAVSSGQFAEAYRCYEQCLALQDLLQDDSAEAELLQNVASLNMQMGDYAGVREDLKRARQLLVAVEQKLAAGLEGNVHPRDRDQLVLQREAVTAQRLLVDIKLTQPLRLSGRTELSIERLSAVANQIHRLPESVSNRRVLEAFLENERGTALYNSGRFQEARLAWHVALRLVKQQPSYAAEVSVNLGWCALSEGDASVAEQHFREAQPDLPSERRSEVQSCLARALVTLKRYDEARQLIDAALAARRQAVTQILQTALSERDRQAYLLKLRNHTEQSVWPSVFDTYLELAPVLGIPAADQYANVLSWKGVLSQSAFDLDVAGSDSDRRRTLIGRREALLRKLRQLVIAERQQAQSASSDQNVSDQLQARIQRDQEQIARLERDIRQLDASSAPTERTSVTLEEVARAIPKGAALLDLVVAAEFREPSTARQPPLRKTLGFFITPQGTVTRLELGRANEIAEAARAFTEAITRQRAIEQAQESLNTLVARPVQTLSSGLRLLFVSGDGWLHRVPLGVLSGADSKYWIEETAFAQVASAASLIRRQPSLRTPKQQAPRHGALIVGGLDYGSGVGRVWPYLLGTWQEASQVARQLAEYDPGLTIDWLVARQCDKQSLQTLLRKRRIVHLATHGFFNDRESELGGIYDVAAQLDSGVVLTNANHDLTTGSQYLLTGEEIGREDLSGIDLMVLSACNTGLGHLSDGESIIGLLGALDRAGVRCVVSALWEVDDSATKALMESFYDGCLKNNLVSPAEAMRQTQIKMLRGEIAVEDRTAEELKRPYFWAAWTVMGWSG